MLEGRSPLPDSTHACVCRCRSPLATNALEETLLSLCDQELRFPICSNIVSASKSSGCRHAARWLLLFQIRIPRHSTLLPSIPNKSKHNAPSPRLSDQTKRSRACRASPTHALSSPVSRQTPTMSMSQWIPPFPNAGNLPISIEAAKKATSPRPSTPNPKPKTQNPKPKTPSPKPQTPNPKPQTSNLKQTPNPDTEVARFAQG